MSRINPRQVEAFHKVILTGGITQAANMMNITQPAVSRLIKDFEYALNLKLFDRDGRGLEPREEALKLFREVERIYLGLDHIARIADDIRQSRNSVLRVGAVSALSALCTESILPSLLRNNPELSLFMDVESTTSIIDMVLSNQYDVGFIYGRPTLKGLRADLLGVSQAVAVMAIDHPLSQQPKITLQDLTRYRAILPGRKTVMRERLAQLHSEADLTLFSPIETSLVQCCNLAAAGLGIAVVDIVTAKTSPSEIVMKPFEPLIEVAWLAIFPPQHGRSMVVEQLVEKMREKLAMLERPAFN
ncbi:LysR family transcriptional regulator [Erwinia sp. OLTSP20]|uniref:LysR family transcriptional regulator n=1 Tax=unclassified Erwinia TaxID=2622719 RepID=UPI000C17FB82|nr:MULTISPECIES: LysR family transcriptional regulator [unclassified Erwinia]PIJ51170.1 LysR family transcriptional regulator [Erwinia sp. OAMSP11]PIJ73922.1 LysR family transcriptional regulator [Erwinia sp. OLSSP12]PIJ83930.1 LysR family transcriptional regulator [Erwinia sp. OLCASP19]PIJ86460.1 LysR family transcriptional regulator [Erwinia sp. OLMTSP26]PIJ87939.1 LysR family transcriptional regulator [Erwinia sp. OLMDSP33]